MAKQQAALARAQLLDMWKTALRPLRQDCRSSRLRPLCCALDGMVSGSRCRRMCRGSRDAVSLSCDVCGCSAKHCCKRAMRPSAKLAVMIRTFCCDIGALGPSGPVQFPGPEPRRGGKSGNWKLNVFNKL